MTDQQRLDLSARVRRGEICAFVGDSRGRVRRVFFRGGLQGDILRPSTAFSEEKGWLQQTLNDAVRRHRLEQAKIDPAAVDRASTWVTVEGLGLFEKSGDGQAKPAAAKSEKLAFLLPFGIMMLMFMVILLAAQPMIETVMEERSLRIAEVLLGSVSPSQLMAGKLLGCVAGSLTIVVVYGLGALGLAQYYDVLHLVPLGIVPWFLVYQVLAVLLFSSLFMAVGACVNDRKEAQSMQIPLMLLIVFPMFVWFSVVQQPTGNFAMWMSFVPPATAMLMVLRMAASPDIPLWQPAGRRADSPGGHGPVRVRRRTNLPHRHSRPGPTPEAETTAAVDRHRLTGRFLSTIHISPTSPIATHMDSNAIRSRRCTANASSTSRPP